MGREDTVAPDCGVQLEALFLDLRKIGLADNPHAVSSRTSDQPA